MWTTFTIIILLVLIVVLLVVVLFGLKSGDSPVAAIQSSSERVERNMREEFARNREESGTSISKLREELTAAVQNFGDRMHAQIVEMSKLQQSGISELKTDASQQHALAREESGRSLKEFGDSVQSRITELTQLQQTQLEAFARQLTVLTSGNEEKLEAIRTTVGQHLGELKTDAGQQHGAAREELARSMKALGDTLVERMTGIAN